jgi:hypothetical protein
MIRRVLSWYALTEVVSVLGCVGRPSQSSRPSTRSVWLVWDNTNFHLKTTRKLVHIPGDCRVHRTPSAIRQTKKRANENE